MHNVRFKALTNVFLNSTAFFFGGAPPKSMSYSHGTRLKKRVSSPRPSGKSPQQGCRAVPSHVSSCQPTVPTASPSLNVFNEFPLQCLPSGGVFVVASSPQGGKYDKNCTSIRFGIPCYGKTHMVCRKMDHDLRPGNLVRILTMPIGCMALLKEPVESLPTPGEALPHLVVEMVEN